MLREKYKLQMCEFDLIPIFKDQQTVYEYMHPAWWGLGTRGRWGGGREMVEGEYSANTVYTCM
jgi:hypothetical protein